MGHDEAARVDHEEAETTQATGLADAAAEPFFVRR